jgi:hypothetical protein
MTGTHNRLTRRDAIRGTAVAAGLVWSAPAVKSVRTLGTVGTPPPETTTSTTAPSMSPGCIGMNDPSHDSVYSSRSQTGRFHAGDRVTIVGADLVPGTVDTFTVTGPEFGSAVVPLGQAFTYTFQADTPPFVSVVAWFTNVPGPTRWTVGCEPSSP